MEDNFPVSDFRVEDFNLSFNSSALKFHAPTNPGEKTPGFVHEM